VLGAFAALLLLATAGVWRIASGSPAGAGRHVLVISVDGMGSSYYMSPPPGLRIPNLRRLMKEGSYAEAVEGIYPTVTYPSHTTLVTGRLPVEHGIYTNLSSRQAGKNPRDWFWFSKAIKVPTLWDEARRAHLTSATVAWPVSVGADADWDVPEIWNPAKPATADPLYVAKYMSPLLSVELLAGLGPPKGGSDTDTERTRLAIYLLEKHKPNLMLVHLDSLDDAEHDDGPGSSQAAAALERIDTHIGEFVEAVTRAGLEATTDVFVVSDHGFLPVHRTVSPNLPLEQAGLFTKKWGAITGGRIVTVANGGSFFIYWPQGEDLWGTVDAALKPLREQGLVWSVFDREALHDMGSDPQAQMALEAPDGTEYTANSNGALVEEEKPRGTHGFLPYRKGLEASFIAWGHGIRPGLDLHHIPMTAVAPTILKAMGINDPKFGDSPPLQDVLR
jgi:predicted AlkP superfamily pyrophosphatase or phosphodiesterase